MNTRTLLSAFVIATVCLAAAIAEAQPVGTFRWQLQPYCNVVTVAITQNGSVYRLEGTDDQCGAGGESASVIGTAFPNASGSIGFGLNIVSAPGGAPGHVEATVTLPATSGTWRDSAGRSGAFVFTPGAGTGGSPRPTAAPTITIGATGIDPAQVQLRVSGTCSAGLFMQSIGQSGSVGCAAASTGGGITGITAGTGLAGGGTTGNLTLALRTTAGAFDFANGNGLVAAGTFGAGNIGASGPGTRLLWHPRKAAFRAGLANSSEWDDASIGNYSFAAGQGTVASGVSSVAIGSGAATGPNSFAVGGTASGNFSTALSGGAASGQYSFAAGVGSQAIGNSSSALGFYSRASGSNSFAAGMASTASGDGSVAIGTNLQASNAGSVLLGSEAAVSALSYGSFIFGDRSTPIDLVSYAPNEFLVRAAGGVGFYTNAGTTSGLYMAPGGSQWLGVSDVSRKHHFNDLDGEDVLAKLARIPVMEWSYTTQDAAIRHAGPTAQDFHAAFGLGEDPLRIGTMDADGIALAAVKALETRTRELRDGNSAFNERVNALTRENDDLRARLARLEALLDKK